MLRTSDQDEGEVFVLDGSTEVWSVAYDPDSRESQKQAHYEAHIFIAGAKWQQAKSIGAPKVNSAGVPVFEGGE
jgi:hypothetical protein